eukprot:COSAG01_NODE_3708_length_5771_cov_15.214210_6_plen_89_part_00
MVVVVVVVVIDGCGDDVDDDVGGIHIVDHHRWGQVGRVEWDAMVAQVQEMSAQQRQLANLITSSFDMLDQRLTLLEQRHAQGKAATGL